MLRFLGSYLVANSLGQKRGGDFSGNAELLKHRKVPSPEIPSNGTSCFIIAPF